MKPTEFKTDGSEPYGDMGMAETQCTNPTSPVYDLTAIIPGFGIDNCAN